MSPYVCLAIYSSMCLQNCMVKIHLFAFVPRNLNIMPVCVPFIIILEHPVEFKICRLPCYPSRFTLFSQMLTNLCFQNVICDI